MYNEVEKGTFFATVEWTEDDDGPVQIEEVELVLGDLLYREAGDGKEEATAVYVPGMRCDERQNSMVPQCVQAHKGQRAVR